MVLTRLVVPSVSLLLLWRAAPAMAGGHTGAKPDFSAEEAYSGARPAAAAK